MDRPTKTEDYENMNVLLDKFGGHIKALNLGCGFVKIKNAVNVDKYENCKPDVVHDLNEFPYPFEDESFDTIYLDHVLEHLEDWWGVLRECGRILKPGGWCLVFLPDESTSHALAYRDHLHVFTVVSFHNFDGACMSRTGTNAYARQEIDEHGVIPLRLAYYKRVPFGKYAWMDRFGFRWILRFCCNHMRNFVGEQHVGFEKTGNNYSIRKHTLTRKQLWKANIKKAENRQT
jgi:SAM-dependent methyltransferase